MLALDCIGLLMTVLLVAPRYFHYVIVASIIQECGRIVMILFLQGKLEGVMSAGVFGTTTYSGLAVGYDYPLILACGWLFNYMVCCLSGGIAREPTAQLLRPMAKLVQPFAVINLRFMCLSIVVSLGQWLIH